MAWTINEDYEISMTRGDTFRANIEVIVDDEVYTPVAGDSVRFALKHKEMKDKDLTRRGYKDFEDDEPLLVKEIPIDTMILEIEPEDTKNLGFGKYRYDLEITFSNGDVDTFVANTSFEITPEVH